MDREKIIENMNIAKAVLCNPNMVTPEMCIKIGQTISDALFLLEEQEWISVNDRLPNCNGCYLVWRPHFYPDKGMPSICYFDGQNIWHDSYGVDFTRTLAPNDISHWMPLPEQPCKAVSGDESKLL